MLHRLLRVSFICLAAASFAACGDDPEPSNNQTNNETPDAGMTDPDTDVTDPDTDVTDPDTGTNNPQTQCVSIGDACDLTAPTASGFVCEDPEGDGTGECFQGCTPPQSADEQYPCPAGRVCTPLTQGGPALCLPSDCSGIIADDCDAGLECFALINDAYLCLQAGDAAQGESCADAQGNLSFDACDEGLRCSPLTGTCEAPCDGDAACTDSACVGETDGVFDDGVGVCGEVCDPYQYGSCADGESCFPITATEGLCFENTGTLKAFEVCGVQGGATCGDNLRCVGFTETEARCLPFCDPTAQDPDSTCAAPAAQAQLRFAHLVESANALTILVDGTAVASSLAFGAVSGEFVTLSPGTHTVSATNANNDEVFSESITVDGNDALTLAIQPSAALGGIETVLYPVPRFAVPPAAGSTTLRIGHAIDGVGAVDVVAVPAGATDLSAEVILATGLAAETASDFVEVPASTYDIYVFLAGATRDITLPTSYAASFEDVVLTGGDILTAYAAGTALDNGLVAIDYARAYQYPDASASFSCLDLAEEPGPSDGACIQDCTIDDYGTRSCGGQPATNACTPTADGGHACFPGGGFAGLDQDCEPGDCREGAFCRIDGTGAGTCASYCETGADSNPLIGCDNENNTCVPFGEGSDLGACQFSCDEADFSDTDCPTNLQSCLPANDTIRYCAASGDVLAGADCGDIAVNNCVAGTVCANKATYGFYEMESDLAIPGTCAARCNFFDPANDGCGATQDCVADFTNLSTEFGVCLDRGANLENTPAYSACNEAGKACGERGICAEFQDGSLGCLVFCEPGSTEANNCPMGSACLTTLTQGGVTYDLSVGPFGYCIPGA